MKLFSTAAILLLLLFSTAAQAQIYLQAQVQASEDGTGDMPGHRLLVAAGYTLPNKLALGISFGTASYSSAAFSESQLINDPDLLIRNIHNTDPTRFGAGEGWGTVSIPPQTNFAQSMDIALALSRTNTVYRSFGIYTGVSAGMQRVRRTDIVEIRRVRNSDGYLDGTFARSKIDAYLTPLFTVDLGLVYEGRSWSAGPVVTYSGTSPSTALSYGVLARVSLCSVEKGSRPQG